MNFKSLTSALTLILALPLAHATPFTAGTGELVGFHPCIAGPSSPCDSFGTSGPDYSLTYSGLAGQTSSSTGTVTLGSLGTAGASATLGSSAVDGAPVLRAYADSAPGARIGANAIALQSYTWNGQGPATRTFGGTLTYSQTMTGVYPPQVWGGVNASFDIFTMSPASVDGGTTSQDNFDALSNADGGLPGYTDLGWAQFEDGTTNPDGSATLSATVTLVPGETIWVWSVLQAIGTNGGTVDASHTLDTGWNDSTGLIPAATVPEPATLGLLLGGVAACAMALRRRRIKALRS